MVVESGFQGGFGNMVVVQHNARQSTVYAHLSKIGVRKGQAVKQGDNLGAVGATGCCRTAQRTVRTASCSREPPGGPGCGGWRGPDRRVHVH